MDAVPNLHPTFQNNALVSICCFAANTLFFAHDSVSAGQCKLPRKCNLVVDCRITIRYAKSKVTVMKQCRWRKTVAKLTRIQNEPLYDIGLNRDTTDHLLLKRILCISTKNEIASLQLVENLNCLHKDSFFFLHQLLQ